MWPEDPAKVLVKAGARAPLRNRTVDLLLTIYPRLDAVANWDDAGQVRGGGLCCSPTYLFITPAGWAAAYGGRLPRVNGPEGGSCQRAGFDRSAGERPSTAEGQAPG